MQLWQRVRYHWRWKRSYLYRLLGPLHLQWVIDEYDQRKLDQAKVARFQAFCESRGLIKVNGKWEKGQ